MDKSNYSQNFVPKMNVSQQNHHVDSGYQNDFVQTTNFEPPPQYHVTDPAQSVTPHQSESKDSYCGRLHKNRRQLISVAGGLILMINSGLHIGWGIWRTEFMGFWILTVSSSLLIFMIMAWSVGAFIGGFIGSVLTPLLRKNFIYYLSAGIVIIGDVVILIWDENGDAIAAARLLIGVAHGIGYVTLITHAGENAAKNMRGTILSMVNCMLYTGIFVSVIITGTTAYWFSQPLTLSSNRIVALVSFVLAILTIVGAAMTIETVPFLLRRNCHESAKFNLMHLRGSSHNALELTREMEELHSMTGQDQQNSWNIFTDGNGKPLVLTTLMRIMVAMTNNHLLNILTMTYAFQMFYAYQYRLVPIAVVAPRLAMSIVQIFYADVFKRKIQIIFSSTLAGIVLIIIGIVLNTVQITSSGQLWTATVAIASLWLVFQFSCSLGMDQMQDVYLSEAFSTAKKRWSLPFVAGIEHLFHIFMIGMFFAGISSPAHLYAIIFVTGFVVLIMGIVLVVALPETRNMTLKQAKDSFADYSINMSSPFA